MTSENNTPPQVQEFYETSLALMSTCATLSVQENNNRSPQDVDITEEFASKFSAQPDEQNTPSAQTSNEQAQPNRKRDIAEEFASAYSVSLSELDRVLNAGRRSSTT